MHVHVIIRQRVWQNNVYGCAFDVLELYFDGVAAVSNSHINRKSTGLDTALILGQVQAIPDVRLTLRLARVGSKPSRLSAIVIDDQHERCKAALLTKLLDSEVYAIGEQAIQIRLRLS